MSQQIPNSIPKPLVTTNQVFIVVTSLLGVFMNTNILFIPFLLGLFTVLTKINPVVMIGKPFLRKPLHTYHPEDKDQQIFNQWIATISLGLALLFFYLGWNVAGYIFAGMVIAASGIALTGFCIGCWIRFQYQMWKHRRKMAKNA